MKNRLKHIQNWPAMAMDSNWKSAAMARQCDVSVRTLERYFNKNLGQSPKEWLLAQRQQKAITLLRTGSAVKEVAISLGYRHPSQFSRDFKRYWGQVPMLKI